MEEMLEKKATLASPMFDELVEGDEDRMALLAEELREAIRRKVARTD
jgi:hypothetical protein